MDNAEEALSLIEEVQPDILLLDINISGEKDGVTLAQEVVGKYNLAIIFLTAFSDLKTLSRAKKVKPAAYIIKPYEDTNLAVAIDLAFSNLADTQASNQNAYWVKDCFYIRDTNHFCKVKLNDILYIEAKGSYSQIMTEQRNITVSMNLKTLLNKISLPQLYRIHCSFAVNVNKVDAFDGNQVIIGGITIPIGPGQREAFLARFRFI